MKMRKFILMAIIVLAPAALAGDFGIRAGQYRDAEQEFIGVEMLFDTGALNINPNIEYSLEDDITAGSANLDVTVDVGKFSTIAPYVGAGLGLIYVDTDRGGETTELVGNLIGGVAFELGSLKPYAQLKYFRTLEDDDGDSDDFAVAIGLRF
jgi:opacity protein-like surface antigen